MIKIYTLEEIVKIFVEFFNIKKKKKRDLYTINQLQLYANNIKYRCVFFVSSRQIHGKIVVLLVVRGNN